MYRPEGWQGYHCGKDCTHCYTNPVDCNKHYEAGADATIEALKGNSIHSSDNVGKKMIEAYNSYWGDKEGESRFFNGKFYIVMIPDESALAVSGIGTFPETDTVKLSEEDECLANGGHCYRNAGYLLTANRPIKVTKCQHCDKTQQTTLTNTPEIHRVEAAYLLPGWKPIEGV